MKVEKKWGVACAGGVLSAPSIGSVQGRRPHGLGDCGHRGNDAIGLGQGDRLAVVVAIGHRPDRHAGGTRGGDIDLGIADEQRAVCPQLEGVEAVAHRQRIGLLGFERIAGHHHVEVVTDAMHHEHRGGEALFFVGDQRDAYLRRAQGLERTEHIGIEAAALPGTHGIELGKARHQDVERAGAPHRLFFEAGGMRIGVQHEFARAMSDPGADQMLGDFGQLLIAQQVVDRVGDFRRGFHQRTVEVEHHQIEHGLRHPVACRVRLKRLAARTSPRRPHALPSP